MYRLHMHVSVPDLDEAIRFYSALFAVSLTKIKDDYAKWMLDDPAVNFAISSRGDGVGLDHLGIQVDSSAELAETRTMAEAAASGDVFEQGETTCCYAKGEKHWTC